MKLFHLILLQNRPLPKNIELEIKHINKTY